MTFSHVLNDVFNWKPAFFFPPLPLVLQDTRGTGPGRHKDLKIYWLWDTNGCIDWIMHNYAGPSLFQILSKQTLSLFHQWEVHGISDANETGAFSCHGNMNPVTTFYDRKEVTSFGACFRGDTFLFFPLTFVLMRWNFQPYFCPMLSWSFYSSFFLMNAISLIKGEVFIYCNLIKFFWQ